MAPSVDGRRVRLKRYVHRSSLVTLPIVTAMTAAGQPAGAIDLRFADGALSGSFDTTVTLGAALRTQDRDDNFIGVVNGGRANSINVDDGNLNFDQGDLVSLRAKVTHELDLNWRNLGFFGRAFYFYDAAIMDIDPERTPFSGDAKDQSGRNVELLDAFVSGDFQVLDRPVNGRIGNQVISWGESTFIPNGINTINPVDVAKLRVAGAEIRDALVPILAVDASVGLTDKLSLEGFWQLTWNDTQLEPVGTFFSTDDTVGPGGRRAFLGFGQPPIMDFPVSPPGTAPPIGPFVQRGSDNDPEGLDQFGFALRYFAEELNDTEFGLYYIRTHSRTPVVSARAGTLDALLAGDYAASARYFRDYSESIDLVGASFSTGLPTGLALQGEVSYRINQPLQVDDVELLYAALSPVNPPVFGQNQLGVFGFGEDISGFRRKDVLQAQMTASQVFGPTLGTDQILAVAEIGGTYVLDMEDKSELRYNGPATFTSGNPFFTEVGVQPATTTDGFADDFSWGYRLLARADYFGAIGPVNLQPQIAFAHDVKGTTPQPLSTFVEGRKAITLTLGASYLDSVRGELSYTNFFGGGDFNMLKDRDFVSMSLSYFF